MENVQNAPSPDNQARHNQDFLDRKHDLISAMANSIGLKMSEREIRESVYHAKANVEANEKLQSALQALPRIAAALENQAGQ
jgi:precorrin isomerase